MDQMVFRLSMRGRRLRHRLGRRGITLGLVKSLVQEEGRGKKEDMEGYVQGKKTVYDAVAVPRRVV